MKVRLTRKHAERIDGVDLTGREPGDVLDVSQEEARLLVVEEWAIPERREHQTRTGRRRRTDDYPDEAELAS